MGAEAKDLKRDMNRKSLGDWMTLYGKKMEALQPSPREHPLGNKTPKTASLLDVSNQVAKGRKSKQAHSKADKVKSTGIARATRTATRGLTEGTGKERPGKAAGMGKEGRKGKEAAGKEGEKARVKEMAGAEALVELKTGKPVQAKGKRSGLAGTGKRKAGEGMGTGLKREKKARVAADGGTSAQREAKPGMKATDEELQQPAVVSCLPRAPCPVETAIAPGAGTAPLRLDRKISTSLPCEPNWRACSPHLWHDVFGTMNSCISPCRRSRVATLVLHC